MRRLQKRFRDEEKSDFGAGTPGTASRGSCSSGRPYTALSPDMSKGIPEIFGSLGVKTFFQDMVPYGKSDVAEIAPLLETVHWKYAAKILEAACVAAHTPNLYPVFVTSFKCSPDSFAIEYFKRILDSHGKPYLVLQLDDHDSARGLRDAHRGGGRLFPQPCPAKRGGEFPCATVPAPAAERGRGRPSSAVPRLPVIPRLSRSLAGKTLLFPNWDPLLNPLAAACLRREGIDARILHEDPLLIRTAMRHNTGQCIPLNIIAEEAVDYIRRHGLDPARTALWMPRSSWSCNITMLPPFLKSLFESFGGGMQEVEVYSGELSLQEISFRASLNAFRAAVVGGLLRRVGCRLRPYEIEPGATDRALEEAMRILVPAFEGREPKDAALRAVVDLFDAVEISPEQRPKVAIFGDLYVRDNDVMSQDLTRAIERAGGEVISHAVHRVLPHRDRHELPQVAGDARLQHVAGNEGDLDGGGGRGGALQVLLRQVPGARRARRSRASWNGWAASFSVRSEHAGESADNLQKVFHLVHAHPDIRLFVQASPAFCCPSLITEAMARTIERLTGVPVVSVTYDGTGEYRNGIFEPWLRSPVRAASAPSRPA